MDLNKAQLIGRLTSDAMFNYTGAGTGVVNFTIAVEHMRKKDGTQETSFFHCKAFGRLAENIGQFLKKGKQVGITAYLKQDRWVDKEGKNQSRVVLNCEEIQLLGGNVQGGDPNEFYGTEVENWQS